MSNLKPYQEGPLLFEQPFAKVPLEASRKAFRTSSRNVDRDLAMLSNSAKDLLNKCKGGMGHEEAYGVIEALTSKVRNLKRKVEEMNSTLIEPSHAKVRRRLTHLRLLDTLSGVDDPAYHEYSQVRLDRWLVDWALRTGRLETAKKISEAKHVEDLVDIELFSEISAIEASLVRQSCQEALQWCNENRLALKRMKSNLEFDLRLQEFVELIRGGKKMDAILYMKRHLVAWQSEHRGELEMVMGILAYGSKGISGPHKRLYDLSRWEVLAKTFRQTAYTLCSLSSDPMLHLALYAGLASLKFPACFEASSRNRDCPVCDAPGFGTLATEVPFSHHSISTVICRMSGKITDENNPPMAFPDGSVYSLEALENQAMTSGLGYVSCPRSETTCQLKDLRKVFVS